MVKNDNCFDLIRNYYGGLRYNFQQANPNLNCEKLKIGQRISLHGYMNYQTSAEENCSTIAKSYMNNDLKWLKRINPQIDCKKGTFKAGKLLSVPGYNCSNYNVKEGDNCFDLIKTLSANDQNNTGVFYTNNGLLNCTHLQVGKSICMPGMIRRTKKRVNLKSASSSCQNTYTVKSGGKNT
jgi:hypothetical protein